MLETKIVQRNSYRIIELNGRIDGLTCPDIEKELQRLTSEGERLIVINFACVNYISSAGLRIFLSGQKMLKKIGGELVLVSLQPQIFEVFRVSGFDSLFRVFNSEDALQDIIATTSSSTEIINGIKIQHKKLSASGGKLRIIGNQDKLQKDLFNEKDVITVKAPDIQFGAGLAVLGDNFNEFKNLFGETVVINHNFFTYPAAKKSAVDFMLKEQVNPSLEFNFLYGFMFSGSYYSVLSFSERDNFTSLDDLVKAANELSTGPLTGIVLLAESAGIHAMNLRRSPVTENKPAKGGIFNHKNFADWIDFPLEPAYANNIIAATGVIVKDKALLTDKWRSVISEDSDFHIHCGIFEKDFLSKDINSFDNELKRVFSELQPYKVQHLLGRSKFKNGMLALIELEEC
jgi:anti-anti-sigma factor